jgi:uncharacterized protein YbjT (DUF2867 family)
MRILVTGAGNLYGQAIVRALLVDGHQVRVFGGDASIMEAFAGMNHAHLHWYAGDVKAGGSIEPALSERQVLVHVAGMDEPGKDRKAHAAHIEKGARYARYGAEREQVDHFILVAPESPPREFLKSHIAAAREADLVRGTVNHAVVRAAGDPNAVAAQVAKLLEKLPELGKQPGRENDAVTA